MSGLNVQEVVDLVKSFGTPPIREIKVTVNDFIPAGEPVLLCNRADFERLKKALKPEPVKICGMLSDPKEWT